MSDTVITDLDDCYARQRSSPIGGGLASQLIGESYSSGPNVILGLFGLGEDYERNDQIHWELENADRSVLVTGRPGWNRFVEKTEEMVDRFGHAFDDIVYFPGVDSDDEQVVETELSTYNLFTGNNVPGYKKEAVAAFTNGETRFFDDASQCREAVAMLDGVAVYDEEGERYGMVEDPVYGVI